MKIILIKVYRFLILVFYNYLSEIILIFLQTLIRLLSCIELISELLILKIILMTWQTISDLDHGHFRSIKGAGDYHFNGDSIQRTLLKSFITQIMLELKGIALH